MTQITTLKPSFISNKKERRLVKRGEVYYIKKFHTDGNEIHSGRPAVVISNDYINANSGNYEIVYMTLQEKNSMPTHIKVNFGNVYGSTLICEQVTTISEDKLGDYICELPKELMETVDRAVAVSLGLCDLVEEQPATVVKENDVDVRLLLTKQEQLLKEAISEAELYKRMYDSLLDRVMKRG